MFNILSPLTPSLVVLHEAVCTGNPELIGMVLRYRDQQQKRLTTQEIPLMLERLRNASDFYIEMKWEFSSWGVCKSVFIFLSYLYTRDSDYCSRPGRLKWLDMMWHSSLVHSPINV